MAISPKSFGIVLVLVLALTQTSASAATVTYTSSAAFFAALGGAASITEGYETLPIGTLLPNGTTLDSLTYTGFPLGVQGLIGETFNRIGDQSLEAERGASPSFFISTDTFTITFPGLETAVGVFFNAQADAIPGSYFLQTSAGSAVNSSSYDQLTLYFVGLISDTAFSSAIIGGNGAGPSGYNVDNLTYSSGVPNSSPVPEPSMLTLAGLFSLGAIAIHRRVRRWRVTAVPGQLQ